MTMRRGIIAAVVAGAAGVMLGLTPVSGAFAAGLSQTQPAVQAPQTNPNGNWNRCDDWRGNGRWGDWRDWRDWRDCCDRWGRDWCWNNWGRGGDGRWHDHRDFWNDRGNWNDRGFWNDRAGWDWYWR
ncbi:hypothetical protein ACWEPM_33490 [Streptomyces sp. NPDC004244]|uniref:hypothetical protein n=1 Tax=Streptomyces sp. NPDC101206 TaxID=3366128 RepID=UPI00381CC786